MSFLIGIAAKDRVRNHFPIIVGCFYAPSGEQLRGAASLNSMAPQQITTGKFLSSFNSFDPQRLPVVKMFFQTKKQRIFQKYGI
jgi:hypothetical protein